MRKVTILQVLLSVSIIQVSTLILHYYNVLNNLLLVWLPTIILFGIIILTIFITWFSYKYFNNGRGNWNDQRTRN